LRHTTIVFHHRINQMPLMKLPLFLLMTWLVASHLGLVVAEQSGPALASATTPYEDLLVQANILFKERKLDEALATIEAAKKLDAKRFEASATAAVILHASGKSAEAKAALDEALMLVPADKKKRVDAIAKVLSTPQATCAPDATSTAAATTPAPTLTLAARRQHDALQLISEEADKASTALERRKLLYEFMTKSAEFLVTNPFQTNVWVTRAAVALELEYTRSGWEAGRHLRKLGVDNSDDPKSRKVMAMLERRGWLGVKTPVHTWNASNEEIRALANEGNTQAQLALAAWYSLGKEGLPKDMSESAKWYRKAAEGGEATAQFSLGLGYENGNGVNKDIAEAIKWYRKAAEQGDAAAQNQYGYMLWSGTGVAKNHAEAAKWYREGAEAGHKVAQYNLGVVLCAGQGVTRDPVQATRWLRASAEQGYDRAQLHLARHYANGEGVARDAAEARKWYGKAADQGNEEAKQKLAELENSASANGTAAPESGDRVYTVVSEDNLAKIAKRFVTTVWAIRAANNLTTDRVTVGQKLKIPSTELQNSAKQEQVLTIDTFGEPIGRSPAQRSVNAGAGEANSVTAAQGIWALVRRPLSGTHCGRKGQEGREAVGQ